MKKLLCIFLALFMAVAFAGCGGAANDPGPGPVTPPIGGEGGTGPEEGKGPEEGGDPETATELPDADLLAFSIDRLKQADLSFDFAVPSGAAAQRISAPALRASLPAVISDGKEEWQPHVPVEGETHSGTPADLLPPAEDFFESNSSVLDLARDRAEEIRETVLESITLMNTAVHAGLYSYVLDYDAQTDTLHVIRAPEPVADPSTVTESYDILIYPDEDGDETVEYWCIASQTGRYDRATHLIYTSGKRYYIEATDVFPSADTESGTAYQSDIREMYREGDEWFGYSLMFRTDIPFFNHRGTYEMAGLFSFEFVTETADGIERSATGAIHAYDGVTGEAKAPQESYAATDVFKFEVGNVSFGEGFYIPYGSDVTVPGEGVDGWNEVQLRYVSDGGGGLREEYTVAFENGASLGPDDFYKKGSGILHNLTESDQEEYQYVCENEAGEKVYFTDWEELSADRVTLTTQAVYIAGNPIHQVSFTFAPDPGSDDPMGLVKEFWDALGLSVREGVGAPSDLLDAFAETDAQAIADGIMLDVYDGALGLDGVGQICEQATETCDATVDRLKSVLDGYETVEWEDMPARPAEFGLVSIAGSVKGQAAISEGGIDFSAVTLDVKQSVVFSKGKEYALYVTWGVWTEAVSDPFEYQGENFTLTGKNEPLPDLPVGTHTASIFIGKVMENGCARLSDAVPVSASGTFTLEGAEERGLQKRTDFLSAEGLKADVALFDVEAPKISVNGSPAEATPYELTFAAEEGKTVSDLYDMLTVNDNAVGVMSARNGAFTLGGIAVFSGDALVSGTYVYTVADGSGNSAQVTFHVTVTEPEPGTEEEGTSDAA